jgi:glutamyl/glutaminyl-tRNA synthetase
MRIALPQCFLQHNKLHIVLFSKFAVECITFHATGLLLFALFMVVKRKVMFSQARRDGWLQASLHIRRQEGRYKGRLDPAQNREG